MRSAVEIGADYRWLHRVEGGAPRGGICPRGWHRVNLTA